MTEKINDDDDDDDLLDGYVNVEDTISSNTTSVLLDKINATIPRTQRRRTLKRTEIFLLLHTHTYTYTHTQARMGTRSENCHNPQTYLRTGLVIVT